MTPEAGIDMNADFLMDETFLKTKTKAELLQMVKDMGLKVAVSEKNKKSEIVTAILAQELVGKATAEITDSCMLKELKDVSAPIKCRRGYETEPEDVKESEAA